MIFDSFWRVTWQLAECNLAIQTPESRDRQSSSLETPHAQLGRLRSVLVVTWAWYSAPALCLVWFCSKYFRNTPQIRCFHSRRSCNLAIQIPDRQPSPQSHLTHRWSDCGQSYWSLGLIQHTRVTRSCCFLSEYTAKHSDTFVLPLARDVI